MRDITQTLMGTSLFPSDLNTTNMVLSGVVDLLEESLNTSETDISQQVCTLVFVLNCVFLAISFIMHHMSHTCNCNLSISQTLIQPCCVIPKQLHYCLKATVYKVTFALQVFISWLKRSDVYMLQLSGKDWAKAWKHESLHRMCGQCFYYFNYRKLIVFLKRRMMKLVSEIFNLFTVLSSLFLF